MLQPVGPVLVFAASNFPFAFSVPGGDTASALAAGCPVVVKAHPGHPRLSDRTADVLASALVEAGAPTGVVNLVHGVEAGATALRDPRIKAAAFTGSEGGGRALFQIANQREQPIPFYGELGSLNPVFVTPGAIAVRGNQIVDGYVASFTLGIGQFCTKPGVLLVPVGHGLEDRLVSAVRQVSAGRMLTERIRAAFVKGEQRTAALPRVRTLVRSEQHDDVVTAPSLFTVTVPDLLADPDALLQECFGPTSVVVEYDGQEELLAAARAFAGNLTATVHGEATSETEFVRPLLELLRERAGRLVWNGWPTGVAVAWSMHHGGPYPATTASLHTSVGATALRRFQSPVVYQDMPADLLPEALADRNVLGIPRRVDGTLTRADLGQAR
jgi:NADP-dependent aldehyde dehydrogenase